MIENVFHRYGDKPISRVLDLGCGTGNHAFPLASRGYEVVGIDRSESMLVQAHNKLAHAPTKSKLFYRAGDIRSVKLEGEFDAALMMFAVLGYQLENKDVLAALQTARQHVRTGALFIYDVWYGPAVLHQRPSERSRVIPTADGQILRIASGQLDVSRHLCSVHFHLWQMPGKRIVSETEETHLMRYFYPLELIEQRRLQTSDILADYSAWPSLGQVFVLERQVIRKKTEELREEVVTGVTNLSPERADAVARARTGALAHRKPVSLGPRCHL